MFEIFLHKDQLEAIIAPHFDSGVVPGYSSTRIDADTSGLAKWAICGG